MKLSKRQLAARYVDALETTPVAPLTTAIVELAVEAGYDHDDLVGLVAAVEQELQTRYGLAEVRVTTAHTLSAAALDALAATIAKRADLHGFSYSHRVDPELLGGFEAQAGDLSFHNSIRGRLKALEVGRG